MDPITQVTQGSQPTTPVVTGLISPNKIGQLGGVSQNLVNPVGVSTYERPTGFWKSIVLDVIAILCAAMFGFFSSWYLSGGISFWIPLAILLVWGAAEVVEGFLQKNQSRRFLIIFLEGIAATAFFYSFAWQALALALIAIILCLSWGYLSVRRELRNTIEIRFFTASGKVVGKVITGAIIFAIIMYASLANDQGSFFVSQNGFNQFFNWAAGFVNNFYPTVPLNGSFGDFAQAVARMQLQGNPAFRDLTTAQQNTALTESAAQVMNTFENASGTVAAGATSTQANPAEPTQNVFYDYFAGLVTKLQDRFNSTFIGVWGLAVFLILRSAGIIVVWIGQLVALLFYEILLATGFMKINEQGSTKENLEY